MNIRIFVNILLLLIPPLCFECKKTKDIITPTSRDNSDKNLKIFDIKNGENDLRYLAVDSLSKDIIGLYGKKDERIAKISLLSSGHLKIFEFDKDHLYPITLTISDSSIHFSLSILSIDRNRGSMDVKVEDKITGNTSIHRNIILAGESLKKLTELETLHKNDLRISRVASTKCLLMNMGLRATKVASCIMVFSEANLIVEVALPQLIIPFMVYFALTCAGQTDPISANCEEGTAKIGDPVLECLKGLVVGQYSGGCGKAIADYLLNEEREAERNKPASNSTGDPHLITFDGASYDFQAHGEFIAAKSTTDNFEVQVRQEDIYKSGFVTFNTAIAVQTGTDIVSINVKPNWVFINNQSRNIADVNNISLKDGASITSEKEKGLDVLKITSKNGDIIKVVLPKTSNYLDYYLFLSENRKNKVIGLMGNYDGDKTNDILIKNGENILKDGSLAFDKLYPTYADSWRITQSNSLFYYDPRKNTNTYTQKDFPRSLQTLTSDQKTKAEGICRAAGVSAEPFLSNCIVDVAITNNPEMASSALFGQDADARNSVPIPIIQEAVNVKKITSFGVSSYILKSDGTVWASGWNDHGRFGIGSAPFDNKNLFRKIMDGVKDIASGNDANHMLFLKNDNTVWAAGLNGSGEIGNGATNGENVLSAVKVMNDGKLLTVAPGSSFIIKTDHSLWATGNGTKLINGRSVPNVFIPTKVFDNVKDIALGPSGHVLLLKTDNSLWGCGDNLSKQLSGASVLEIFPATKLMDNVRSLGAGREFSLVVKTDNTLWGTGENSRGELGNGKNTQQAGLAKLMDGVQAVSVGSFYSLILKTDKTLWVTGDNSNGQLGDGSKSHKNTFTKIADKIKYISTGGNTTFIVKEDNTVWATGDNQTGELGDGTQFDRLQFVPINVK